jgi:hypothetical protein
LGGGFPDLVLVCTKESEGLMPANTGFDPNTANMSELEQVSGEARKYKLALEDILSRSFDSDELAPAVAKSRLGQCAIAARVALDPNTLPPGVGP